MSSLKFKSTYAILLCASSIQWCLHIRTKQLNTPDKHGDGLPIGFCHADEHCIIYELIQRPIATSYFVSLMNQMVIFIRKSLC